MIGDAVSSSMYAVYYMYIQAHISTTTIHSVNY